MVRSNLDKVKITWDSKIAELPTNLAPQAAPKTWEAALAQLPPSGRVLVAGTGRGGISLLLAKAGYDVVSLDLHPEHFKAEGLTCGRADFGERLSFESSSFDVVVAVEVIEHLEALWIFCSEALRVTKNSGRLVISSPNVSTIFSRFSYLLSGELHYLRYESFIGCYHVSPIFRWAVDRWCKTVGASLVETTYSRVDWPTQTDVPKFYSKLPACLLKKMLPLNSLTREIAVYTIVKGSTVEVSKGLHYA
jgi:SAM-dependent methyltransferase